MTKTSASGHDTKHVRIAKNHCFACGPDNADGMHLKFRFDERAGRAWCRFRLPLRFQGPPGHAHGGIIATILDEAMGKVNKLRSVIAVTKTMDVEYLKLVPLRKSLIVEGRERSVRGRKHVNVAQILNDKGEVLARSRGLFIAIDPARMFAKHLRPGERTGPVANADGVQKKRRKVVK
ncbi:MAG: PaaI family thioesterase [Terriglobales bacterium]|jgi:acyl-coenzyme A thioesterase PaaI-like protein